MRTEAYPDIWGHVSIWIIYAVLFTLFYFNLKKSRHEEPDDSIEPQMNFSWRLYLVLALIFITSSAFMKILQPISAFFMVFGLFLGIGIGIVLFILSIVNVLKKD